MRMQCVDTAVTVTLPETVAMAGLPGRIRATAW